MDKHKIHRQEDTDELIANLKLKDISLKTRLSHIEQFKAKSRKEFSWAEFSKEQLKKELFTVHKQLEKLQAESPDSNPIPDRKINESLKRS